MLNLFQNTALKVFRTCKLQVIRAKANTLYKSFEMLFSVDGGPLTDNVVFVSDQRVHVLKRAAVLTFEIPISFISG